MATRYQAILFSLSFPNSAISTVPPLRTHILLLADFRIKSVCSPLGQRGTLALIFFSCITFYLVIYLSQSVYGPCLQKYQFSESSFSGGKLG